MTNPKIHQLLERYWQCETSLEEERLLMDFFTGDSVPEELKVYQSLFIRKSRQKAICTTPVQSFVPKKPVMRYFYPAMKIAASILIVLTFGIGVYTNYKQEQFKDRLFSESASDVLDARRDSIEVMAQALLQLLPEQTQDEDSLQLTSSSFIDSKKE